MSYEDTLSEIERTLDKAGVGTQRTRLHNLGSIFPSQAERVEMLVEERDEAREDLARIAAAAGLEEDDTDRLSIESAIQAMDSTIRRLEGDRDAYQQAATDAENAAHAIRSELARLLEAVKGALGDVDTMEAAISEDVSSYDAEGLLNTFGHMRRSLTAALAGEGEDAKVRVAELRSLLLAFIEAEAAMASDCDGVYPEVFDVIQQTIATLRDAGHPCTMCGGVDWRIRATPGGVYDEVFERCDHQPIEDDEDPTPEKAREA